MPISFLCGVVWGVKGGAEEEAEEAEEEEAEGEGWRERGEGRRVEGEGLRERAGRPCLLLLLRGPPHR